MGAPRYSLIMSAFTPGDVIWVLSDDYTFKPVEILKITRKSFMTDVGEILFEDHDWLWRATRPDD